LARFGKLCDDLVKVVEKCQVEMKKLQPLGLE
jgi:hypothetical protein